ncbi:MAG: hypothetical protein ACWA5P_09285 [bacterium]
MKFVHRLGYYLGGFSIGLIFLAFFLSGKKTSCAYGPEARVLKNINTKPLVIGDEIQNQLNDYEIDSTELSYCLRTGNVIFKKSNTKKDSCKEYHIEKSINKTRYAFLIENCDSLANLVKLQKLN